MRPKTRFVRPNAPASASTYAYRLRKALSVPPPVRYLCLKCKKNEQAGADKLCEACR